jgi:hypothetical protein
MDQIALIDESVNRINLAVKNGDLALAIGCSKDLSESIAKIAIYTVGGTFASSDSYKSLISAAHKAVDRQPTDVAEVHTSFRVIIQAQKNIVGELGILRNDFGTGHGHARRLKIENELALTSIEACLIWSRWMMRRLDDLLANSPNTLRKQLDDGGLFYGGDLTKMLQKVNLPKLDEVAQRAIGVSVARRARTGTYNVAGEGIEACLNRAPAVNWTRNYKLGLIIGLVSNTEGQIYLTRQSLNLVEKILLLENKLPETISFLIESFSGMKPATRFEDLAFKNEVLNGLQNAMENYTEATPLWQFLLTVLSQQEKSN